MKNFLTVFLAVFSVTTLWSQTTKGVKTASWMSEMLTAKKTALSSKSNSLPYESPILTRDNQPVSLEFDVTGLDELILSVWATGDGYRNDNAVWADAVLIDKNGNEYKLQDEQFTTCKAQNNRFRAGVNFAKKPFSIGSKTYSHGFITLANSLLITDLKGRNIVKYKTDIGIDASSGPGGTVVFKVLTTSGVKEAEALVKKTPEASDVFTLFKTTGADWLTTKGMALEATTLLKSSEILNSNAFVKAELERIATLPTELEQFEAYISLGNRINRIIPVQEQLVWLNIRAIKEAFADFSTAKGYDKATYQAKLDELILLSKTNLNDIYTLENEGIERAEKALALRKEILFSNKILDFDKIVLARYGLNESARSAGAPLLGTPPANYSSQLQARRTGHNSEIIEISNLRGELQERSIYKPSNGGSISEPELHWNADKILFTSTNEKNQFQLFEVNLDGSDAKQVTNIKDDTDLEFFDATYLPSGKIVTASNISYNGVPCVSGADYVSTYCLFDPETNQLRRLTFDQDCNWSATTLHNGKVMFTRWEYTDLMHYYSRIVMTMNPDGTEQKGYVGSGAIFPNATFDMKQLPGNKNRFVGIISGHHGTVRSGRMIIFDPSKARKGKEGMVQEILKSKEGIDDTYKDRLVDDVWPKLISPQPLSDNYYLVAAKPSPTALWGIYLTDIYDNLTLVAEFEGEGLIWPMPVMKREIPAVIPEKTPMEVADTPQQATVFIQDIYEGEGLVGVPRGTVKQFRVMSYEYAYWDSPSDHMNNGIQSGWEIKRELGLVDVNPDGSALFNIPANTPISLQPIDSTGAAVQLMRSWLTAMPGEVVSCVGCHEDQNSIAIPKRVMASQQDPIDIVEPEGGVRPFTFEREIQPILDRACLACHNDTKAAGGINYSKGRINSYRGMDFAENRMDSLVAWGQHYWSKAYLNFHPYFYRQGPEAEMAVLNPYEYHVDNSEMIQMLRKGHHGVELTEKEWKTIYTWVDFNLPYDGVQRHNPHKSLDGNTYDQYERRIELSKKYAGNPVYWKEELDKYGEYLKSQPKPEPVMPEQQKVEVKEVKVKGWPFSQEVAEEMVKGKEKRVVDLGNGQSMTFVYIPKGTFIAGGSGTKGQAMPTKVAIKKGFWMAEKEVSNEQIRALLPDHSSRYVGQQWKDHTTPGYFVDSCHLAATKVSFNDAMLFSERLSEKTGFNVTLPTSEQWEWAARSGSNEDFWYGSSKTDFSKYENFADKQLNDMAVIGVDPKPMGENHYVFRFQAYIPKSGDIDDGSMLMTAPGSYLPNHWGLYDINGNVAEWTSSQGTGDKRIVKGGSWYDRAKKVTVSDNREFLPWHEVWNVGFRPIILE